MTSSPLANCTSPTSPSRPDSRTSPTAWAQPSAITTTMAFRSLRHQLRIERPLPQQRHGHLHRRHARGRCRRPTLVRERRLRRLRQGRPPRPLRRQLSRLHRPRQQGLLRSHRPARLLHPARLPPRPRPPVRNLGNGKFQDVSQRAGIGAAVAPDSASSAPTSTATAGPTSTSPRHAANLLWINQGNGTFQEGGLLAGVAYARRRHGPRRHGRHAGDFDGDG